MIHSRVACWSLLPITLLVASPTQAAFIALADGRRLHAEEFTGVLGDCGTVSPGAAFETWSASHGCLHGGASQGELPHPPSTVGETELAGGSQVSTTGGGVDVDVESVYEIEFAVSDPTPYRIMLDVLFSFESGVLSGGLAVNPGTGAGVSLLLEGIIPIFEHEVSFDVLGDLVVAANPTSLAHTGTLQPGSVYTFTAWIRSDRQAFADGAIEYSLVQVPEPATGLLMGIALAALAGCRRRP